MPYITSKQKRTIEKPLSELSERVYDLGEFTYAVYYLALSLLRKRGVCYKHYAEILGALTATQHELYRREIGPYEEEKLEQNGDVRLTDSKEKRYA